LLSSSLASLSSYSESSLHAARLAVSEVKRHAAESDAQEVAQIEAELSRAEGFSAGSLYANSIVSSEKTIRAANAFLEKKGAGSPDAKALLLGGISLAFLAAAAYYFATRAKHKKKEKRELPKEEQAQSGN